MKRCASAGMLSGFREAEVPNREDAQPINIGELAANQIPQFAVVAERLPGSGTSLRESRRAFPR